MPPKKNKGSSSRAPPAFGGSKASTSTSDRFTVCALVENRARETCIAVIKASRSAVLQASDGKERTHEEELTLRLSQACMQHVGTSGKRPSMSARQPTHHTEVPAVKKAYFFYLQC